MPNNLLSSIRLLNEAYDSAIEDPTHYKLTDHDDIQSALDCICRSLMENPNTVIKLTDNAFINNYCEFYVFIILLMESVDQKRNIQQLMGLVQSQIGHNDKTGKYISQRLVEHLVLSLDLFSNDDAQLILDLLGNLTNRNSGTRNSAVVSESEYTSNHRALSQLFEKALFSEVWEFLTTRKAINKNLSEFSSNIVGCDSNVISIGSRKGGVGKSTIAMLIAMAAIERSSSTCIIDLDLTGPVWQYLLFPKRNEPKYFLNDVLSPQPVDIFNFAEPSDADIEKCISIAGTINGSSLGLLAFADLPRTSRLLRTAISLRRNQNSYLQLLTNIIRVVSKYYNTIIIDNSPGFDSCSLLSFVVTDQVNNGTNIIVSSPQKADIYGTFIELADFRLLNLNPPLWLINKADEETKNWFSKKHSEYEIIQKCQSYDTLLPSNPSMLLSSIVKRKRKHIANQCLGFDNNLNAFLSLSDDKKFIQRFTKELGKWPIYKDFIDNVLKHIFIEK